MCRSTVVASLSIGEKTMERYMDNEKLLERLNGNSVIRQCREGKPLAVADQQGELGDADV